MKKRIGWFAAMVISITSSIAGAASGAEVKLTPQDAVARAIHQNLDLAYERLAPALTTAPERVADSAFDPVLFADASATKSDAPGSGTKAAGEVGVRKTFSTTGTSIEAKVGTDGIFGEQHSPLSPEYSTALSVTVRQPLLKGASKEANEVGVTTARLGKQAAESRLERKAETVAQDTLKAYWDLHAALSEVEVQKVGQQLSEKTLAETQALIKAGKLAAAEEPAAQYQVEVQKRGVLQAQQAADNARDKLARLIGLVGPTSLDTPAITTIAAPKTELPDVTLASLQSTAFERRGDHEAAELDQKAREAEAKAADHNLLPKLDLVGGLTASGLAGDPTSSAGSNLAEYDSGYLASLEPRNVGWSVGLMLEIPLGNREAEAKKEMADLEVNRANIDLDRIDQQISQELNVAWRGVNAAKAQLQVTESAASLADTKAKNELERYRAGKTTAQILTTVQADLVKERLAREQAIADFNKALVDLYTASGTLVQTLNVTNS